MGGYAKVSPVLNTGFNVSLSLILIACSMPLLLIIALIIKLQGRGPVLYNGVRLGRHKKPFVMYKFRTLIPGADKIIGAEVLTIQHEKHKIVTTLGKFLRDTRLDELPQLFNILKGEIDFLGPRPLRPDVYDKLCKQIRNYDQRFSTKPGLIGYSQLCTPHSAPKKIRMLTDNKFLKKKQNFILDILLVLYTIFIVIKKVFVEAATLLHGLIKSKIFSRYKEKRTLKRLRPKGTKVYIGSRINDKAIFTDEAQLIDINEEAFLIYSHHKINQNGLAFKLERDFKRGLGKREKKKSALCHGKFYRESAIIHNSFKNSYVIQYTPISSLNNYRVNQYFLFKSMIH